MNKRIPAVLLILSIALVALSLSLSGCVDDGCHRVEKMRVAMNTDVAITLMHPDTSEAESAIDSAFAEVYRIEHLMSHTEGVEVSEVARLNKDGFLPNASSDLRYVLNKSIECSELSNGSFDVTVFPVINLWTESIRAGAPPTSDEINETLKLVNYRNISIKNGGVYFNQGSMGVTLGGIAKGYAIDRAITVMEERHIKNALVNAGGDVRALGYRSEGIPWRVALQNPENKTEYVTIMYLSNVSAATSGNYERYFSEAARRSHIIDPKTGYAAEELLSATIIAKTATDADALATAVFVSGEADGMELIEHLNHVEGLIITGDRRILRSSGFADFEGSE